MNASAVSLEVTNRNKKRSLNIETVYIQPKEKFHMPSRPQLKAAGDMESFHHLKGLKFDAVGSDQITILIGSDAPEAHLQHQFRKGKKGQPYALKTMFGWTLFGPAVTTKHARTKTVEPTSEQEKNVHCSTIFIENEILNATVPSVTLGKRKQLSFNLHQLHVRVTGRFDPS